ncbi:hypothetical protein CGLO_13942 [Colletotrichum gloeosporioides Cg-14]
MSSAE